MGVLLRTEHSQDIIVLVHWLSEVPSLLLIPPVAVRVSELPLDGRGILVVAILSDPICQHTRHTMLDYEAIPDQDLQPPP